MSYPTKHAVLNYKYGSSQATTASSSHKKRKNKKNKSKEVQGWDDMDYDGNKISPKQVARKYIPPKYTFKELKKMEWGDIDEIPDDEYYGYFVEIEE